MRIARKRKNNVAFKKVRQVVAKKPTDTKAPSRPSLRIRREAQKHAERPEETRSRALEAVGRMGRKLSLKKKTNRPQKVKDTTSTSGKSIAKRPTARIPEARAKSPSRPGVPQKQAKKRRLQLTPSQEEVKVRGLAAINRVRKGESKTLTAAARSEGTTVKAIRKLLPGALIKGDHDGRIRVKSGDTYSARVEIITATGPLVVIAHGSRERDLAGLYRSVVFRVLGGKEPASSLRQFRGKRVGGHKLISDFNQLHRLALAGALGQLEGLYASPEIRS
jgi:hypothetical protein